jgi:NAD(P)-dependent dehydrogenase (short-subunit alcohol dehydrogenase family)
MSSSSAKTCLITGATAGIGLVTARELARQGLTVVMVGRNRQRGEHARDSIRRQTNNEAVEFLAADLSSQADIRRLAREFQDRYSRLDVLVNNAGAIFATRQESVDGIEMTLALNHLGYFLLTTLLLDRLKASAPARVINVSSHSHESQSAFDFDDPQAKSPRRGYPRSETKNLLYTLFLPWAHPCYVQYAQSKLANLLFTYELAERLAGTGVTVNALHPGFVRTNFMAGNGSYGWFMRRWASLFGTMPERGADTPIYLATSAEVEGITGKYFVKKKSVESSLASHDPDSMRRLRQISEEWTAVSSGMAAMPKSPSA